MLPPSPDFHELIGLFRVLYRGQQLLRLTVDAIHQQLLGIGNPVMLQDRFSQPTQDTRVDGAKSQSVDQQSRSLPDDFVLEDEVLWLDGVFGKVRFQLEEGMELFTVADKDRRLFMQDGEGGCLLCRHGFELHIMARPTHGDTVAPKACSSW